MLAEKRNERDAFGGADGKAINRHSVRYYRDSSGNLYILDRNLSCCPPCYSLHRVDAAKLVAETISIPQTVKIGGSDYFGDGLTWTDAEAAVAIELGATITRS